MASSFELRGIKARKVSERNTLVSRKSGVDSISNKINTEIDNYVLVLNNTIAYCSSYFATGLKGKKSTIDDDINDVQQKYSYVDSKISSSNDNFRSESKRCQDRIDTLNNEISSLDIQISNAEWEEEQARQKALEEMWKAAAGGDIK